MHVRLIAVDKIRSRYISDACDVYRKRLRPYLSYEEVEVRASDGRDPDAATSEEAERVMRLLRVDERVWLLERHGEQFDSEELAHRIGQIGNEGIARLTFVVAGTYGAGQSLVTRADVLWSLSKLTFLHEWTRMLVLEQLYRAAKIMRDEPYHH
jgi:23S rRNA (pseudouridine1915-N3)-methyltransferase